MRKNAFRTNPAAVRYQAVPAKIHATPRRKPSAWQWIKKADNLGIVLAGIGVTYMVGRFVTGLFLKGLLGPYVGISTIAAVLMLVSALMISIDGGRDNHRLH